MKYFLLTLFLMACNTNVNEPIETKETKSLKKALEDLDITVQQIPVFGTNEVWYGVNINTNLTITSIYVNGNYKTNQSSFLTELDQFEIFVNFSNGDFYQGYVYYVPNSDPPLDPPIGL